MNTFLKAEWQNIIMVNYEIDASYLLPYLPKGVELDYFHDKTYISLVGFLFKNTSIFNIPIPLVGTFEEVNLRFYVIRKTDKEIKRGVVFINETVPNKIVAWVANMLYKEHYSAIPTKHIWSKTDKSREIEYYWKVKSIWNSMKVATSATRQKIEAGSIEEFIFEHYYGYTKVSSSQSIEYKINHPSWKVLQVNEYHIDCDFGAFYGSNFEILNNTKPHSVLLAEGSNVSVDWRRVRF